MSYSNGNFYLNLLYFSGFRNTILEKMTNIILFGPPGSGKGTQAKMLEEKFDLLHISTGDLFRYEMGNDTTLGLKAKEYISKGELVPDEITVGMLKNKVNANAKAQGFIFDGFPRTTAQAEALDEFLSEKNSAIHGLIALDVEEKEIIQRILQRGKTSGRTDDLDPNIIKNRIEVYLQETAPVYDHYSCQDKAQKINGHGSIQEIFERLTEVIQKLQEKT